MQIPVQVQFQEIMDLLYACSGEISILGIISQKVRPMACIIQLHGAGWQGLDKLDHQGFGRILTRSAKDELLSTRLDFSSIAKRPVGETG
jgi:hypothetical protein